MRSDMYSDQRPSRVPIFHLSRRLAAATVFVVVVFSRLLPSAYTIIISITTSRTRCSLHTFYRNRKERALRMHAFIHARPCVLSRPERSVPADRQQPAQREGDRCALAADERAREQRPSQDRAANRAADGGPQRRRRGPHPHGRPRAHLALARRVDRGDALACGQQHLLSVRILRLGLGL